MKRLARKLRDSASAPITMIYLTSGSCTNIEAMYNRTKLTMNPKYVPSTAEDPAWTASMPSKTCTLEAGGVELDIANSAVFLEICNDAPTPAGIGVYIGPVQPYVLAVPLASTQQAITAEEAYFVFGFPNGGMVEPWTDETAHHIRTNTKSTLLAWAANINVPAGNWKGMRWDKSSEVVTALKAGDPEKTIGLLGAEILDQNRDSLKSLAFQAYKQKYAYYPDSSQTSFDKKPTREGQYTVWSPTIYLTPTSGGVPTSTTAGYVIDLILGKTNLTPDPGFDSLDEVVGVGLVPECAMSVARDREGGPLRKYAPEQPCGCYFDNEVGTAPASCLACTTDATCGAGKCRHGFCEAR